MGLPPVDHVEIVPHTPEPEKNRERVGRPGERSRPRQGGDQRRAPRPRPTFPDLADAEPVESVIAPEEAPAAPHCQAYGPAAELQRDDAEHHYLDARA